jgi:hypothetical protein
LKKKKKKKKKAVIWFNKISRQLDIPQMHGKVLYAACTGITS